MDLKEKRSFSRTEVEWPVSISTVQGEIEGKIKNISLGGAYMHVDKLPDMTVDLDLSMEIPEHHYALFTTAEPVRLDVYGKDMQILHRTARQVTTGIGQNLAGRGQLAPGNDASGGRVSHDAGYKSSQIVKRSQEEILHHF